MENIYVSHVYCLSTPKYTYKDPFNDGEIATGPSCLSITKEEYEQLKFESIHTEEYTEVVLSKEDPIEPCVIRQLIFKYVARVDRVAHTNF